MHPVRSPHRPAPRRRAARGAALVVALAAALLASGCGQTATPSVPATPHATATPTIAVSPTPAIEPVPTPVFGSNPPGVTLDPGTEARLQTVLDGYVAGSKIPGISAAVVLPGGELWTGQAGAAVVKPWRPMSAKTVFSVASISKTFVAALVLRLAERDVLSLDDPLAKYVPTFPNAGQITVREMLSHTSGIQDLFTSPGMAAEILADPSRMLSIDDVLSKIGPAYFAPGTGYHYSNTNFVLLGLVVERATGQQLTDLVRDEFLKPLGMTDTFVQTEQPATGDLAHGYMGTGDAPRDVTTGSALLPFNSETTACAASCEVASTAVDLARWSTALYGGGVLDDAALASMVDVSPTVAYHPRFLYGLGFEEWTLAGRTAWGHRGHLDGFWSSMAYLRNDHVAVVVLTNAEWADPLAISSDLVTAILGASPASSPSPVASAGPSASGSGASPGPSSP